ncbi:3274_t:CDS:2, partial [Dentiscutata erythropus]
ITTCLQLSILHPTYNMAKKSTNTQMEKKIASKNLTNKLFESRKITLNISPIAIISLFILLTSLAIAWDKYRQQAICQILTSEYEDKIQWVPVPYHKNAESYLSLDNGAFVYRHIYMDEFEKEFNVKPLNFPTIDPDIAPYLAKHNLRARILNNSEISEEAASATFTVSENYAPLIEDIKFKVENGTYVDDGRVYIRWVNDIVRWGMFAGRSFQPNEFLGIYNGFITRQPDDLSYAWEFNNLVNVVDENNEKVKVCIDAKHMGNYMRFANHRDDSWANGYLDAFTGRKEERIDVFR